MLDTWICRFSGSAAAVLVAALLGCGPASAWEFAHGDRDNSGFANVTTAPAGKGSVTVPGLGAFRPGAGPVIAPDGTVYLGTAQGRLIALHADGSPFWSRDITRGQSIVASPAIAPDGSIYVIGVERIRDNRVNPPKETINSTLHRFNSTGAWLAQIPFPDHGGMGPAAIAPPGIWRFGGTEAIIVPTLYANRPNGRPMVRLIAFSPTGQVLDDKVMLGFASDITGGTDGNTLEQVVCLVPPIVLACHISLGFTPPASWLLVDVPPMPGVAIVTGGGTPLILASDHHKDLIGYSFTNQRFNEVFRRHQEDFFMRTPPMILPSGRAAIGLQQVGDPHRADAGRLVLVTPNGSRTGQVDGVQALHAAPTRLSDGRIVVVGARGRISVIKGTQIAATLNAPGRSIASAAASRNHLFVSAEGGFVTYDAATLAEVARVDWLGGGLNPPAIGPKGHVYAIASDILFVFPPPKLKGTKVATVGQPAGENIATNPEPMTTQPQERTYEPPLTVNGNRLFACEELDGDGCGKGDHRAISLAFCRKQGFAAAAEYDVDSRKDKAETLDGRFCAKNKCKVFEEIVCQN